MARVEVERRVFERSFMCAPIYGRSGPVGAHPRKNGALLERWRAQCGSASSTIQQSANSRIGRARRRRGVYWIPHHCFPEPCGRFGLEPSPKHIVGAARERSRLGPIVTVRSRHTHNLSRMSLVVDRDEGQEPGLRQLLALHELRRNMERVAVPDRPAWRASVAMMRWSTTKPVPHRHATAAPSVRRSRAVR
jgi:hypothetical protein